MKTTMVNIINTTIAVHMVTEEDLLGFVSKVMDWRTINSWDDEKVCRQRKRTTILVHPNHCALSLSLCSRTAPSAVRTETRG